MIDSSLPAQPVEVRRFRPLRWGCGLAVALVLVAIVWFGFKVARLWTPTNALLDDLRALQGLDLGTLSSLNPEELGGMRDHFASLEANLAAIEVEAGPFLPLASRLGWLPGVGAELQAAPALLELAGGVATAGRAAMDGLLPALAALQTEGEGSAMARVLPPLAGAMPQWQEAEAALARVEAARAQIDPSSLHPRLAQQIDRLDAYLPVLQAGVGMAKLAPALLGYEQPRTYLLLAQNSDELRATGGFISGAGLLALDRGQIGELAFQDSYSIYNRRVDHPPAPPALERIMKTQMLLLRDSNWSPDFPTSAAVAQALYLLDAGRPTDGVVAFDLEATRRLVGALEPLRLPGYEEPVTSANLITALRTVWAAPSDTELTVSAESKADWWLHRKDFMADLAAAARARVESGQVNLGRLAWAVYSALQEKHLLISFRDPAANALLAEAGWDGALRPGERDYLMVVDSNVGWNKVNSLVQRQTLYQVSPADDGTGRATLDLLYRHTGRAREEPCVHAMKAYGDSYEDLAQRCYFDYVRVYVPRGAELETTAGFEPDTVETLPGERGTTVFAGFMVLPPGEERHVRLTYRLPQGAIAENDYALRVQKQPGIPPWPVQVTLVDPGRMWRSTTLGSRPSLDGVVFTFDLATDKELMARRLR